MTYKYWLPEEIVKNTRNTPERNELVVKSFDIYEKGSRNEVHVVKVNTIHALIQAVGYLKSQSEGPVFFRGQSRVHQSSVPLPSALRGGKDYVRQRENIYAIIRNCGNWPDDLSGIWGDDTLLSTEKMIGGHCLIGWDVPLFAFEPLLQHYGLETRWLDLSDSLPYALFFSLVRYGRQISMGQYDPAELHSRTPTENISSLSFVVKNIPVAVPGNGISFRLSPESIYLYAISPGPEMIDTDAMNAGKGIRQYRNGYVIDMREAIPSDYLRPHAQHGLLFKPDKDSIGDIAFTIFELDTREVEGWLGHGGMFSVDSIYPPLRRTGNQPNKTEVVDTGFYQWEKIYFACVLEIIHNLISLIRIWPREYLEDCKII